MASCVAGNFGVRSTVRVRIVDAGRGLDGFAGRRRGDRRVDHGGRGRGAPRRRARGLRRGTRGWTRATRAHRPTRPTQTDGGDGVRCAGYGKRDRRAGHRRRDRRARHRHRDRRARHGAATDARSDSAAERDDSGADAAGDVAKLNIFYLDVTGGRVMTANAQNPVARVLVASAGQGPDGVAVDVGGGHIYWTGMGVPSANDGFIKRSNLDGTNVQTLVPAGGTYTPKQIKLDLAGGKMYWSDREGMRVMRANLDGSSIETLVTTGQTDADRMNHANWCVGIALDLARGYVYWSQKGPDNGHVGSLRRAHIAIPAGQTSVTRTDIEILYTGLPEPIDIDLDLTAGYIYWTDRGDDTVSRGPIEIPAGLDRRDPHRSTDPGHGRVGGDRRRARSRPRKGLLHVGGERRARSGEPRRHPEGKPHPDGGEPHRNRARRAP